MTKSIPFLIAAALGVVLAFLGEPWGIALAVVALTLQTVNAARSEASSAVGAKVERLAEDLQSLRAAHVQGAGQRLDMHAAEKTLALEVAKKLQDAHARISALEVEAGLRKQAADIQARMGF